MALFIIFIIFWVICGVIHYGVVFAYLQKEYPFIAENNLKADRRFALVTSLFGPIALIVDAISGSFKHGFRLS